MAELTLNQVLEWTGGKQIRGADDGRVFREVGSDTRLLKAGQLFIALRGASFNGHDFLVSAVNGGAGGLLIDEPEAVAELPAETDVPVIVVEDTLRALQALAAGYRDTLKARVIAVTGSVGKTSTRQMIAACLGGALRVHQTSGNLNNEIGLPQTLLQAPPDTEAIVVEMGMRAAGEIALLSRVARPDIALITNVGWSHIERLGSRQAILDAKAEILEGLKPDGLLLLNADDEMLRKLADRQDKPHRLAWVSAREGDHSFPPGSFTVRAGAISSGADGVRFRACLEDSRSGVAVTEDVRLPMPGRHQIINTLFGLAAAYALGVRLPDAAAAAAGFQPVGNRQRLIEWQDIRIIDDTYNAAPESMQAALQTCAELTAADGRKIAALGCMMELGDFAPQAHRQVGAAVAELDYDLLLVLGPFGEDMLIGARAVNPELPSCLCAAPQDMAARLAAALKPGDLLLLKGSRAFALEQVIPLLESARAERTVGAASPSGATSG